MDEDSGIAMKDTGKGLEHPEREGTAVGQTRQLRKSGRPRLDSPGAAVLSSDRRAQIRQAQKTYRLKKEATVENFKSRTIELERKLKKLAELFVECHESAVQSNLQVTHPALFTHLLGMRGHLAPEIEELGRAETSMHETIINSDPDPNEHAPKGCGKRNDSHNAQPTTSFDYQVSNPTQSNVSGFDEASTTQGSQRQSSPGESSSSLGSVSEDRFEGSHFLDPRYIDEPLGGNTPITYSFHETTFSRRLHRYSLEHAYRVFIDPRSNPSATYRLFRLVSCIREKTKMLPYFRRLVRSGVEDLLEIPSLPFYCIGNAGSHYPRKDHRGDLIYPSNMRLPGRILGIFPGAKTPPEAGSLDIQSRLKLFGFDGDWFDCQDVQGYLEENGVILDQSSLVAKIHMPTFDQSAGVSEDGPLDKRQISVQGPRATNNGYSLYDSEGLTADNAQQETDRMASRPSVSPHIFDLEFFLSMLLRGLVILGRAPGFKRSDVEAAFKSALRIQDLE